MTNTEYTEAVITLNSWAYAYYTLDNQIASDAMYDKLYFEVKAFEEINPTLLDRLSPTQRVGDKLLEGFEKSSHIEKMFSLDDVFNNEGFITWAEKIKVDYPEVVFYAEPKYDGLSLNMLYERGELIKGTSRGDGLIGEDITENLVHVLGIPLQIPYLGKVEIRGEVTIFKSDFPSINAARIKKGKEAFKNERGAAAGALRSFDSESVKSAKLRFTPYGLGFTDMSFETQSSSYEWIIEQGFINWGTNNLVASSEDPLDMIKEYEDIIANRSNFPMLLDGVVVKVNQKYIQEDLGFTNKYPKWGIAFKFPADEQRTTIKDIVFQVGKTGSITPVAIVSPTFFDGIKVERVTLHNFSEISRNDIRIGDIAAIIRSGDVIPKIVGIHTNERTGSEIIVVEPTKCPVCSALTEKRKKSDSQEETTNIYCSNRSCPAILTGRIQYAVGKKALDIRGFGDSAIEELVNKGIITKVIDLYSLSTGDMLNLEGFAIKKAEKIISGISSTIGTTDLYRVLNAIDIDNIGETYSKKLAKAFGIRIFSPITDPISKEELLNIDDIGEAAASSFIRYMNNNSEEVELIRDIIQPLVEEEAILDSNSLEGKVFIITGTLSQSRPYFAAIVEANGGKIGSSVSKKTDYLLAGENAGSKLTKAEKLGITVITESDFMQLV